MDGPTYLVDAATAVSLEFDAEVEVRDEIERGQLVQKVAAVNGVHAAEDHVAPGNGADGDGIEQRAGMSVDDSTEAHGPDCTGSDIDFEAALLGVIHGGVQDAVEVLLLDAIGVDEHEFADAVAGELLD